MSTRGALSVGAAIVVGLVAWKAIVVIGGYPPFILPPPETVGARLVEAWARGTIQPHFIS
jgi:ABC-type nitrate/sulfonate/bicarbonate transport system permease component